MLLVVLCTQALVGAVTLIRNLPDERVREFAWTASRAERLHRALGPRHALGLAIATLSEQAWIACRGFAASDAEFACMRRVAHFVRPRRLLPDLVVLDHLARGNVPDDAPLYWLDPAPHDRVPPPAGASLAAEGDGYRLWRIQR